MGETTSSSEAAEIQQQITPGLAYDDAPAAIDFLCRAFGFEERFRFEMPDGSIGHAELAYASGGLVTLATSFEPMGFASPRGMTGCHTQLMCRVDDLDAHYRRAMAAGATCVEPQEDHGSRMYRAVDLEGHRWIFSQPLA